jgi:hypothetical protein
MVLGPLDLVRHKRDSSSLRCTEQRLGQDYSHSSIGTAPAAEKTMAQDKIVFEDASRLDVMHALWTAAGLQSVQTRQITVQRTFGSFDDYWETSLLSSSGANVMSIPAADREVLRQRLRAHLPIDAAGRITDAARANAIRGSVPG